MKERRKGIRTVNFDCHQIMRTKKLWKGPNYFAFVQLLSVSILTMLCLRTLRLDKKELRKMTNTTTDEAYIGSLLMYGELQDGEKKQIEGT